MRALVSREMRLNTLVLSALILLAAGVYFWCRTHYDAHGRPYLFGRTWNGYLHLLRDDPAPTLDLLPEPVLAGLVRHRGPQLYQLLLAMLESGDEGRILYAIVQLQEHYVPLMHQRAEFTERKIALLEARDPTARLLSGNAFDPDDEDLLGRLEARLPQVEDDTARRAFLTALQRIGSERALEIVEEAVRENPAIKPLLFKAPACPE